jgi:hypothetical protein
MKKISNKENPFTSEIVFLKFYGLKDNLTFLLLGAAIAQFRNSKTKNNPSNIHGGYHSLYYLL